MIGRASEQAIERAIERSSDRASERASDRAFHTYTRTLVHAYTRTRVKRRFSENTYKPTISDVQTTLKREDVSMPIQKISPEQDLETQLQKTNYQNY